MKKIYGVSLVILIFSLLLISSDAFAQGKGKMNGKNNKSTTCKFIDANNDGKCDNFVDANNDGKCDNCSGNCTGTCDGTGKGKGKGNCGSTGSCSNKGTGTCLTSCASFVDANNDGKCDSKVDANNDGKCDNCTKTCTSENKGKGMKGRKGNCGSGSCKNTDNTNNIDLTISNIFPVPVKDQFTITLNSKSTGVAVISIYDNLGNKINESFNGNISLGEQTINIDTKNLQNGNYLYSIEFNGKSIRKPFIVSK
jgi:hypothetical protein